MFSVCSSVKHSVSDQVRKVKDLDVFEIKADFVYYIL
jgi:hypothetical protein